MFFGMEIAENFSPMKLGPKDLSNHVYCHRVGWSFNVGKSTLFNRITGTDHAIVSELSGLTRDRQYGLVNFNSTGFVLIDAGGITDLGLNLRVDDLIFKQSQLAIEEADLVILLVDASIGLHHGDYELVRF